MTSIPTVETCYQFSAIEYHYLRSLADWADRLLATFRIALGAQAYDAAESVDPTRVKIPKSQWLELCGCDMNWVNIGPSSYDDSAAEPAVSADLVNDPALTDILAGKQVA